MKDTSQQLKEWFEANYLDGDKIQGGQTLSSEECFDALTTHTTKLLQAEIEFLEGMKKKGNDGEDLPFENSPEIYGNQRIESYKKGYNQALQDQILHLQEQIIKIKE